MRYKINLMTHESLESIERRAEQVVKNTRGLLDDLVEIRNKHDISQKELADRMGVSQSAVSQMERYDANPTLSTIERYAIAVGARIAITAFPDPSLRAAESWTDPHHTIPSASDVVETRSARVPMRSGWSESWTKVSA